MRPVKVFEDAPWFQSYDNVFELGTYLTEQLGWNAEEVLAYFEKPWKWSDEWDEFQSDEDSEGTENNG